LYDETGHDGMMWYGMGMCCEKMTVNRWNDMWITK